MEAIDDRDTYQRRSSSKLRMVSKGSKGNFSFVDVFKGNGRIWFHSDVANPADFFLRNGQIPLETFDKNTNSEVADMFRLIDEAFVSSGVPAKMSSKRTGVLKFGGFDDKALRRVTTCYDLNGNTYSPAKLDLRYADLLSVTFFLSCLTIEKTDTETIWYPTFRLTKIETFEGRVTNHPTRYLLVGKDTLSYKFRECIDADIPTIIDVNPVTKNSLAIYHIRVQQRYMLWDMEKEKLIESTDTITEPCLTVSFRGKNNYYSRDVISFPPHVVPEFLKERKKDFLSSSTTIEI